MTLTVDEYVMSRLEKICAFRHAMSAESDRGCALFAAAYLDTLLCDLLQATIVVDKRSEKDLFTGTAPLASFSARIKMCYYLGLISDVSRRDLDRIRSIRNDFAHNPEISSFSHCSIGDRCRALTSSLHAPEAAPRDHFSAAVMSVLGRIDAETITTTRHVAKADDGPSEEDKAKHRRMMDLLHESIGRDRSETAAADETVPDDGDS